MAVELRCPKCKAKLRLPQAPEPDSEIECSKCGFVFPTDDNLVHAGESDEAEKPAKRKPVENDEDNEKPKKQSEANAEKKPSSQANKNDNAKAADKPFKRKRRRGKKKKTNPVVMWGVIGGAVMILGFAAGILLWLMGRTTSTQEMMNYLPDDCDEVTGVNINHLRKYPEFNKACEPLYSSKGFKKAADVFSKALGSETDAVLEYVIQGEGKAGGKPDGDPVEATVLRTKMEFDTGLLSKIPGAKEYSANGVKYYTIDDIPELKYPGLRVFAPTNRLVIFCRGDIPEPKFKAMLAGNKDNLDNAVYKRAGPLIKGVTRGTAWKFILYGRSVPGPSLPTSTNPTSPGGAGPPGMSKEDSDDEKMRKDILDILNSAKGMGFKASIGSRDVRGEWVTWYKDSDAASSMRKKWKEKDWVKDDEKEPPRWWKTVAMKSGGGKTAENALKDGLSFRTSGETFSIRTSLETKTLKDGISQLISSMTGQQGGGSPLMSGGGMPGGPGGPGGAGPGGPKMQGGGAGPGNGPGGPKMPGPGSGPSGTPQPGKPRRRFRISRNRDSVPLGSS